MPVYEEKEKINGQKRYFIRTYVTDEFGKRKQITRHTMNYFVKLYLYLLGNNKIDLFINVLEQKRH